MNDFADMIRKDTDPILADIFVEAVEDITGEEVVMDHSDIMAGLDAVIDALGRRDFKEQRAWEQREYRKIYRFSHGGKWHLDSLRDGEGKYTMCGYSMFNRTVESKAGLGILPTCSRCLDSDTWDFYARFGFYRPYNWNRNDESDDREKNEEAMS